MKSVVLQNDYQAESLNNMVSSHIQLQKTIADALDDIVKGSLEQFFKNAVPNDVEFRVSQNTMDDIVAYMPDDDILSLSFAYIGLHRNARQRDEHYEIVGSFSADLGSDDFDGSNVDAFPVGFNDFEENIDDDIISDDPTCFQIALFRFRNDGKDIDMYSSETNAWECPKALHDFHQIMREDGAEAAMLYALADYFSLNPYLLDPEVSMEFVQKNQEMIKLYRKVKDIAMFAFSDYRENGVLEYPIAVLIPADENQLGSAVYYENGVFHVSAFLQYDDLCELNHDYIHTTDIYPGYVDDKGYLSSGWKLQTVFEVDDAQRLVQVLYRYWDHYIRSPRYFFPLTEYSYAEAPDSPKHAPRIHAQDLHKTPDEEEKAAMAVLSDFLGKSGRNS